MLQTPARVEPTTDRAPSTRRRRTTALVGAIAVLAIGATAAAITLTRDGPVPAARPGGAAPSASSRHTTAATGIGWHVAKAVPIPGVGQLAFSGGSLYVVEHDGPRPNGAGELWRVDPATMDASVAFPDVDGKWPVAGDDGTLWLVTDMTTPRVVTRVDLATGRATTIHTGRTPQAMPRALVVTPSAVWVGDGREHTMAKLDPATGAVLSRSALPGTTGLVAGWTAHDAAHLYVPDPPNGVVLRLDARTGRVLSRIRLPEPYSPAVLLVGDVLYAGARDHVYAVDVRTVGSERVVGSVQLTPGLRLPPVTEPEPAGDGRQPSRIVAGFGTIWVSRGTPSELVRIDPATMTVTGRLAFPTAAYFNALGHDVLIAGDAIWFRVEGRLMKLEPDR